MYPMVSPKVSPKVHPKVHPKVSPKVYPKVYPKLYPKGLPISTAGLPLQPCSQRPLKILIFAQVREPPGNQPGTTRNLAPPRGGSSSYRASKEPGHGLGPASPGSCPSRGVPGTCVLVPGAGFCASGPGFGHISGGEVQKSLLRPAEGRPEWRCLASFVEI